MKYFVKLIPTKGEVKAHDDVILDKGFNNANIVKVMHVGKIFSNVSSDGDNWDVMTTRLTPFKLFLCSSDIQVSDKFTSIAEKFREDMCLEIRPVPNSKQMIIVGEWQEIVKFGHEQFPNYQPFKVIGEISPAATWVTKEMGFEQEQIQMIFANPVRKTYRNGENNHVIETHYLPNKDDLKDLAEDWAMNDSDGHNYGYKVYWNEKPTYLSYIKIKCPTCGTFH